MKIVDNLLALVGATPGRKAVPPTYRAITDGLIVTATKAEAWFEIPASNTDTMTEFELDAEIQSVIKVAGQALSDVDSHLRIVWSGVESSDYRRRIEGVYNTGDWQRWVDMRAARIDAMELPKRHVLLGVVLAENTRHDTTFVEQAAAPAFGIDQHRVKASDLAKYAGMAMKLGRQLRASRLKARLATAELLSWSLAREQYRTLGSVPRHGAITGANLATLTRGRVEPHADHLRIYDDHGHIVSYTAVLPIIDFPEEMDVPGEGEWLRTLADITRINDSDSLDAGTEEPVIVDASVRFRVLSRSTSLKLVNDTNSLAIEQRKSASKTSAGIVPEEVEDSEEQSALIASQIKRDGLVLVRSHPRLVAVGGTLDELEANITAIATHYAERGIIVSRGADEQRELWLETLPGDQLRVDDLEHIQDGTAFFGSLFWGGSSLSEERGPVKGHLTGSTPGLVHFSSIEFARRNQPTTCAIIGLSGQGKTTFMQLELLDAAMQGAWCLLLDWKGDTSGVITAARELGIPSGLMRITEAHSGAMDLFPALPPEEAPEQVARQLALLAPRDLQMVAERLTLAAANAVAQEPDPSSFKVIERMRASDHEQTRELGNALYEVARTHVGRVIVGEPTGESVLVSKPGLWSLQLPGLSLPPLDSDPSTWDISHRSAIAAMRSVIAHGIRMSSSHNLRSLPKVIGIPEAHRMLGSGDGRDFLNQIARMGRAFGTALLLDSQDAEGIASHEGLAEQLAAVFGFRLRTARQQDALAALLGMPSDDDSRAMIGQLGTTDSGEDAMGHALIRVGNELARMHVDLPDKHIAQLLDTNPDRSMAVVSEREEAIAS